MINFRTTLLASGPPAITSRALSGLRSQPLTPNCFGTPRLLMLRASLEVSRYRAHAPRALALRGGLFTIGRFPHAVS